MNKEIERIRAEFRSSEDARYIHRLHAVLLVLLGLSTVKAGKLLGDPQRTVAHWVIQFRKHGLSGLRDVEKSGRPGSMTSAQKNALAKALVASPKEAGLQSKTWTGSLLHSFLCKRYNIRLTIRQCSRILRAFKNQTKS
jgi:transposase